LQLPLLQTYPVPQLVPLLTAAWVQDPEPLQASVVQGLPSLLHAVLLLLLMVVQPPAPSQVELTWHSLGEQV